MKISIFFIASSLITFNSALAGMFDPTNYDDCVLDGVKTTQTSEGVAAVYRSCKNKFSGKKDTKTEAKNSNVKNGVCELHWDGWKLVGGRKYDNNGFETFKLDKEGLYRVDLSLPNATVNSFKSNKNGLAKSTERFADNHVAEIFLLCQ